MFKRTETDGIKDSNCTMTKNETAENYDGDCIIIDLVRFEELLKAETELGIVRRMYDNIAIYDVGKYLHAIFGPRRELLEKETEGDAE
jgi:hypothetical protein